MQRLLAAELEGKVRFAVVNHFNMEEQMTWKLMMEYWVIPNTYLITPKPEGGYFVEEMWNFMMDRRSWLALILNEEGLKEQTIYTKWDLIPVPGFVYRTALHFFRFN